MIERILAIKNRILLIVVTTALILSQTFLMVLVSEDNNSYGADGSLEVRIQYEGWREDKIPVKATFSSEDLLCLGSTVHQYTNITDVDTLMRTVAKGPKVVDVISAAGIDLSSVSYIVFRTTDGNGRDNRYSCMFTISELEQARYHYPNLPNNYQTDDDRSGILPNEGSLSGAVKVPTILGVSYYSTKNDNQEIGSERCKPHSLYRLCLGQTEIRENEWTKGGYSGDVTSNLSVNSIFGMDVVLRGSPVKGMELGIDQTSLKVGSSAQISVSITGDEAFAGDYKASMMKWSSSDTSVATVDKNGVVTIVGPGEVTITATAPDGTKASIVINGTGKKPSTTAGTDGTDGDKKSDKDVGPISKITAKEIFLGDRIEMKTDANQTGASAGVKALGEAEDYGKGALVGTIGTAVAACGAGFVLRMRKYRIDK